MVDRLKNSKYVLLQQENDPLEFCVLPIPLPSQIGIPCFPCELPNNFHLLESNENFTQKGMPILDFEEESSCAERSILFPSLRTFRMISRDYNNNCPISVERPLSLPFGSKSRPRLDVKFEGQYAGKIEEPFSWNLFKCEFHELIIYDKNDIPKYSVKAGLQQIGLIAFLPFQKCNTIRYSIYDLQSINMDDELETTSLNQESNECVGSIDHLFYGWNNECCSKADQYGISFPDDANERDKALLVMTAVFIDYLWFENL